MTYKDTNFEFNNLIYSSHFCPLFHLKVSILPCTFFTWTRCESESTRVESESESQSMRPESESAALESESAGLESESTEVESKSGLESGLGLGLTH